MRRRLQIVQANQVAAQSVGRTPPQLGGCTPEELFEPAVAAARRLDMQQALASSDVTTREYRVDDRRRAAGLGRALPAAGERARPAARPAAAGRDRRHRAARGRGGAAARRRSRSARCWCARCTTASRTTCRASPGCCSRSPQRKPEVAPAIAEVVGQVQAIAQVYGLQVGGGGPLQLAQRGRGDRRLGAAQLRPRRSARSSTADAAALDAARGRGDPDRADDQRAADQRDQAQRRGRDRRDRLRARVRRRSGIQLAISNPARLPPGFNLARIPGGVSGLGLVRALLPRRGASLAIEQQGEQVVATVDLQPPSVRARRRLKRASRAVWSMLGSTRCRGQKPAASPRFQ